MITLTGIVKGIKTETRFSNGQSFDVYHIGIETNKTGGYENETVIFDIKPSKSQQEQGILNAYGALVGKVVTVPIWVQAWSSKSGNVGVNYHFSGDGKPVQQKGA